MTRNIEIENAINLFKLPCYFEKCVKIIDALKCAFSARTCGHVCEGMTMDVTADYPSIE